MLIIAIIFTSLVEETGLKAKLCSALPGIFVFLNLSFGDFLSYLSLLSLIYLNRIFIKFFKPFLILSKNTNIISKGVIFLQGCRMKWKLISRFRSISKRDYFLLFFLLWFFIINGVITE